jgi:hypothetical protein
MDYAISIKRGITMKVFLKNIRNQQVTEYDVQYNHTTRQFGFRTATNAFYPLNPIDHNRPLQANAPPPYTFNDNGVTYAVSTHNGTTFEDYRLAYANKDTYEFVMMNNHLVLIKTDYRQGLNREVVEIWQANSNPNNPQLQPLLKGSPEYQVVANTALLQWQQNRAKDVASKTATGYEPINLAVAYQQYFNAHVAGNASPKTMMTPGFYANAGQVPGLQAFQAYLSQLLATNGTRPLRLCVPLGVQSGINHFTGMVIDVDASNRLNILHYDPLGEHSSYSAIVQRDFLQPLKSGQRFAINSLTTLPTLHQMDNNCSHHTLNFFRHVATKPGLSHSNMLEDYQRAYTDRSGVFSTQVLKQHISATKNRHYQELTQAQNAFGSQATGLNQSRNANAITPIILQYQDNYFICGVGKKDGIDVFYYGLEAEKQTPTLYKTPQAAFDAYKQNGANTYWYKEVGDQERIRTNGRDIYRLDGGSLSATPDLQLQRGSMVQPQNPMVQPQTATILPVVLQDQGKYFICGISKENGTDVFYNSFKAGQYQRKLYNTPQEAFAAYQKHKNDYYYEQIGDQNKIRAESRTIYRLDGASVSTVPDFQLQNGKLVRPVQPSTGYQQPPTMGAAVRQAPQGQHNEQSTPTRRSPGSK